MWAPRLDHRARVPPLHHHFQPPGTHRLPHDLISPARCARRASEMRSNEQPGEYASLLFHPMAPLSYFRHNRHNRIARIDNDA